MADHLAEQGIVAISPAHLGRVLAEAGLTLKRTRTSKAGPGPDYQPKAARILELRAHPPSGLNAGSALNRPTRTA